MIRFSHRFPSGVRLTVYAVFRAGEWHFADSWQGDGERLVWQIEAFCAHLMNFSVEPRLGCCAFEAGEYLMNRYLPVATVESGFD